MKIIILFQFHEVFYLICIQLQDYLHLIFMHFQLYVLDREAIGAGAGAGACAGANGGFKRNKLDIDLSYYHIYYG
jgi:hypothetical protein